MFLGTGLHEPRQGGCRSARLPVGGSRDTHSPYDSDSLHVLLMLSGVEGWFMIGVAVSDEPCRPHFVQERESRCVTGCGPRIL